MRNAILDRSFRIFKERSRQPARAGRDPLGVLWDRPDSLPFGITGQAFFLLELFDATRDEEVKRALDGAVATLEAHAAAASTYNYGLWQGRGGLLYLYVELYRRLDDGRFLDAALRLARIYTGGAARLFALSGSPDLYGGSSGLALALLHLYAETGEPDLLAALEELTAALLNTARLKGEDIGWDVFWERGPWGKGMAYGITGTAFTFLELGRFFRNDSFLALAERMIGVHEQSKECTLYDRIGSYSIKCYSDKLRNKTSCLDKKLEEELLFAVSDDKGPAGLYFGRAGLGQLCLEAAQVADYNGLTGIAHAAAKKLLALENVAMGNDVGMAGSAGEGYFLLRLLRGGGSGLLLPCVPPPRKEPSFQIGFDSIFFSVTRDLYAPFLRRQFPFTYSCLEKDFATELAALEGDSLLAPEAWIERLEASAIMTSPDAAEVKRLLDKDRFLLHAQRLFESLPPAVAPQWQLITHDLLREEDDFDRLDFMWAPGLPVYHPFPQPAEDAGETERIMALFTDDGADAFICLRTAANGVTPIPLGRDLLAFELFARPRCVHDATADVCAFIQAQETPVQLAIRAFLDVEGPEQVPHAIRNMIRRVVRYYYMEGFLVAAQRANMEHQQASHTVSLK